MGSTVPGAASAPFSTSVGNAECGHPASVACSIFEAVGKQDCHPAVLALEDGMLFFGRSRGALGETYGEICFNTSMEGYLEVITDPSYAGQIITMTYPQIGNYGVNPDDAQSGHPALRGLVVGDMCDYPSNWRSVLSLPEFLCEHGIVAIEGVDTRALVRHIREAGAQKAMISTVDFDHASLLAKLEAGPSLVGANLVEGVSCAAPYAFSGLAESHGFALGQPAAPRFNVVAYDCGVKKSILEGLVRAGCSVTVVPWNTPADDVLAMQPDGVFLSNGPGDPDAVHETSEQASRLIGAVPVFGICLGHQMISLACGGEIEKLKYGHRGGNHPVMNLVSHRVEITAQNHGFGLVFESLGSLIAEESGGFNEHVGDLRIWAQRGVAPVVRNPRFGRIRLTHVNLNDGTCEGIALLDVPAFSVQYHPEATPGPTDAHYLFQAFTRLMEGRSDYLDIDISKDRLGGWKFGAVQSGTASENRGACHA